MARSTYILDTVIREHEALTRFTSKNDARKAFARLVTDYGRDYGNVIVLGKVVSETDTGRCTLVLAAKHKGDVTVTASPEFFA